ncbi:hypothetical protein [Eubacterium aggregans]|uniref:hypothetical protein n=1 Tax=Eubacterium aggregans TaxID=81409 RepID=UPI003F400E69
MTATKAADDSTGSNGIRPDGVEVYYGQDVTVNAIANWSGNSWIYYKDSNGSKKYINSTSTPGRIPLSGYKQAGTLYQYLSDTEQAKDPSGGLTGDYWSVLKYSKGTEAK